MKKIAVPLKNAYRLLNPGSVVLISVGDDQRDNLFALTWNMPAGKDPGRVAILSGKSHFSYPFIERTKSFGINVPSANLVDAVYGCGTTSGREVPDKFARFHLTRMPSEQITAPLVQEAVANLECAVSEILDLGKSSLIVAEIQTAYAAAEHFVDNNWTFENGLQLLHHLSGDRFCVSDRVVSAQVVKV